MNKGYDVLENQMRASIDSMSPGYEFEMNDVIANPPAQLGRTLFEAVQSGRIPNVQCLGKVNGIERYRKL